MREEPLAVLMSTIGCYSAIRMTQFHIMTLPVFFLPLNAIKSKVLFVSEYQTRPTLYFVGIISELGTLPVCWWVSLLAASISV